MAGAPPSEMNLSSFIAALTSKTMDIGSVLEAATVMRDNIEMIHATEYRQFLTSVFPIICKRLVETQPVFGDTPEHKLRNVLFETLNRMPNNEQLLHHVPQLLKLAMQMLAVENEENGIICLRIIIELHKNYRPSLEGSKHKSSLETQVQPFLDVVQRMYQHLPETVRSIFEKPMNPEQQAASFSDPAKASTSIPSISSFKTLTECPIIVVLLFQLFPKFQQQNVDKIMPLIVRALSLKAPDHAHQTHHSAFVDFVAAQYLQPYQDEIPKYAIQLLLRCPNESPTIRRELLIATRHILATDFKSGFVSQISTLLDEQVIVGSGRTSFESLRPLAYTTLFDLVHHARNTLSLPQLSKVVFLYSRNIHDTLLPIGIQTMSAKLLWYLVECIVKNDASGDPNATRIRRGLLMHMLDAFVNKFDSTRHELISVLAATPLDSDHIKEVRSLLKTLVLALKNIMWGINLCSPGKVGDGSSSAPTTAASTTAQRRTSATGDSSSGQLAMAFATSGGSPPLDFDESVLFVRLVRNALRCFAVLPSSGNVTEEKELYDALAQVMVMADSNSFQDVITMYMPFLFDCMLRNQALLCIPQFFLANHMSRPFLRILLSFLLSRMEELDGRGERVPNAEATPPSDPLREPTVERVKSEDKMECEASSGTQAADKPKAKEPTDAERREHMSKLSATLLTRLFKIALNSIRLFPENESVFQRHLSKIVLRCIELGSSAKDPYTYFSLLRSLFRTFLDETFELLYKEFLPLLPIVLEWLNRQLECAQNTVMRDLFVELCLTVPVRLSSLIPFLHLIAKPLVLSLGSANTELVTRGLRTLELCIDSLHEYFYDILEDYHEELTISIWKLLRSPSYTHGPQALRLLGKLGGANRRFRFKARPLLLDRTERDRFAEALPVEVMFDPDIASSIPLGTVVEMIESQMFTPTFDMAVPYVLRLIRICFFVLLGEDAKESKLDSPSWTGPMPSPSEAFVMQAPGSVPAQSVLVNSSDNVPHMHSISSKEVLYFRRLLAALLRVSFSAPNAKEAKSLVAFICRHFAMLLAQHTEPVGPDEISPFVFIDAIVECMCGTSSRMLSASVNALNLLWTASCVLSEDGRSLPPCTQIAFRRLFSLVAHACLQSEWHVKRGGVHGIGFLVERMSRKWLWEHESHIVFALLYVIRDTPRVVNADIKEDASKLVTTLIRKWAAAQERDGASDAMETEEPEENRRALHEATQSVLPRLCLELYSVVPAVREMAASTLHLISKENGVALGALIPSTLLDKVLSAVLLKPLDTHSNERQAGLLDALSFCLSIEPLSVATSPMLVGVLKSAIQTAENDDWQQQQQSATSLQQHVTLRVSCLKVLTAFIKSGILESDEHKETRYRIIGIFCKALTDTAPTVVTAARVGVALLAEDQHHFPPEVVQSSLRPVLANLADFRKLSLPMLQGLSHLLELLPSCFPNTMGEKLLDILGNWRNVNVVSSVWKDEEYIGIGAAIINIFHLLPGGEALMEQFISKVILIEKFIPLHFSSPYREAVVKYLNLHAEDALKFFWPHVMAYESDPAPTRFFMGVLSCSSGGQFRQATGDSTSQILALLTQGPKLQFQGLVIIRTLLRFDSSLLVRHEELRKGLLDLWCSPARAKRAARSEVTSPLYELRETPYLVDCFLWHCMHDEGSVDILFHILSVLADRSGCDYPGLKQFCTALTRVDGSASETWKAKREIFVKYLEFADYLSNNVMHNVVIMKQIISPLLSSVFKCPTECVEAIVDQNLVNSLVKMILTSHAAAVSAAKSKAANNESGMSAYLAHERRKAQEEALNVELLQVATLLVKHVSSLLLHHRKSLIGYALELLKSADATCKQCAFVFVCQFIDAYETPPKVVLQIYVALLRAHQPEARHLVRKALDILTPALKKRIQPTIFVKWTKKIMLEEGYSLQQLVHILQLLVNHPDEFYESRDQFLHLIATSLARLPNSPYENRKLAVDLMEMIIDWDTKSSAGPADEKVAEAVPKPGMKRKADGDLERPTKLIKVESKGDVAAAGAATSAEPAGRPVNSILDMIVNLLIRVASTTTDQRDNPPLSQRALALLKRALTLWPNVTVKYTYFEKLLAMEQVHVVCMGLQILQIVLDYHRASFVSKNMKSIQDALCKCLRSSSLSVVNAACKTVRKVILAFPVEEHKHMVPFFRTIAEIVDVGLQLVLSSSPPSHSSQSDIPPVHSTVLILNTICADDSRKLDQHLTLLLKVQLKLVKEHCTPAGREEDARLQRGTDPPVSSSDSAINIGLTIKTIAAIIRMVLNHAVLDSEQKKLFLLSLSTLVEKSRDGEILECVTSVLQYWITGKSSLIVPGNANHTPCVVPLRERLNLLIRMTRYDSVSDANLQRSFLEMVHHVFSDPTVPRTELVQLDAALMMGLRSRDHDLRRKFSNLFHQNIVKSLPKRFVHVFSVQNWDALSGCFWIKQALDLFLAIIVEDRPLVRSNADFCRLPKLKWEAEGMETDDSSTDKRSRGSMIQEHASYLTEHLQMTVGELVGGLRDVVHYDNDNAHRLWVCLFVRMWESLSAEDQRQLVHPLVLLLSKDSHGHQKYAQRNVLQAFMDGIAAALLEADRKGVHSALLGIDPHVVKYIAKTYNTWHSSLLVLEHQLAADIDSPTPVSPDPRRQLAALTDLYHALAEDDLYYGAWRYRAVLEESSTALSYAQLGMWSAAKDTCTHLMTLAGTKGQDISHVPEHEISVWQHTWIECAKRLNQWDVLAEFAREHHWHSLVLETAWKAGDWSAMKDVLIKHAGSLPKDSVNLKIYQSYLAIHDTKPGDVEGLCLQAIQLSLRNWRTLPISPSGPHVALLRTFQQIIELRESAHIIDQVTTTRHSAITDIKGILNRWRERLPNWWEDTVVWSDLLLWRQAVFSLINNAFKQLIKVNSTVGYIGHHETAWSINKLAHVARKHKLVEVCLNLLNQICKLPNIEIQDAFIKLREQVKCYDPIHVRGGLYIINTTNLEYFTQQQKAEFFQLKGEFLSKIGLVDEAHAAFETSVQLFGSVARGWLAWGKFCDQQFMDTSNVVYGEYAITCFLQAARSRGKAAHQCLARVLWLFSFYDDGSALAKVFEKFSEPLPSWLWIPWIPQLLTSLSSPSEAPQVAAILSQIASHQPQALYYTLRTFLLEQRELMQKRTRAASGYKQQHTPTRSSTSPSSAGAGSQMDVESSSESPILAGAPTPTPSTDLAPSSGGSAQRARRTPSNGGDVDAAHATSHARASTSGPLRTARSWADQVMSVIKSSHLALFRDLELLVDEVSVSLTPKPEEVLLDAFADTIKHCYRHPSLLESNMSSVIQRMHSIGETHAFTALCDIRYDLNDPTNTRSTREEFHADFLVSPPSNFDDVIVLLKKWTNNMHARVTKLRQTQFLEETSLALLDFASNVVSAVEIPGQYQRVGPHGLPSEPAVSQHILIEAFGADIIPVRKSCLANHRIALRGSDGKLYVFYAHHSLRSSTLRAEERMIQLMNIINAVFDKHIQTRRRDARLSIPVAIPFSPRVRIVQALDSYRSLKNIWLDHCFATGADPYGPWARARELQQANIKPKESFITIQKELIPRTILSREMFKSSVSYHEVFRIRKRFTVCLALSALIDHVMFIGSRFPTKLFISTKTGDVWNAQFYPNYNEAGRMQNAEAVPFRLTPNLAHFITQMGITGQFVGTMLAAAMALHEGKSGINDHLLLFFRDDLASWQVSEDSIVNLVRSKEDLKDRVLYNAKVMYSQLSTLASAEQPIACKVSELVNLASRVEFLSAMNVTWMGWL